MKKFLREIPAWIKGGIIGASLCILLFFFYALHYLPFVKKLGEASGEGREPVWAFIPPLVTGHWFPILAGFIAPQGIFCKPVERVCTFWMAETGCGMEILVPTAECVEYTQWLVFLLLAFGLTLVYFWLGALAGKLIAKRWR